MPTVSLPDNPVMYLASPFTDPQEYVMHQRYRAVVNATARLIKVGWVVYSPIVHNYHVSLVMGDGVTWKEWEKHDIAMLTRCNYLAVLNIAGWKHSVGVRAEMGHAFRTGKPVHLLSIDEQGDISLLKLEEDSYVCGSSTSEEIRRVQANSRAVNEGSDRRFSEGLRVFANRHAG